MTRGNLSSPDIGERLLSLFLYAAFVCCLSICVLAAIHLFGVANAVMLVLILVSAARVAAHVNGDQRVAKVLGILLLAYILALGFLVLNPPSSVFSASGAGNRAAIVYVEDGTYTYAGRLQAMRHTAMIFAVFTVGEVCRLLGTWVLRKARHEQANGR